MTHWLRQADRWLFQLVSWVAQALLWSAAGSAFWQVLARFVFESPSAWSEAWTRAAIIWTVMLGTALAFRQGTMLSVDMLHSLLAPRRARLLEHLVLIIVAAFLLFLLWFGVQMSWRVRFQSMPSLVGSIAWVYLAIPVGAALSLAAVLAHWAEGAPRPSVSEAG